MKTWRYSSTCSKRQRYLYVSLFDWYILHVFIFDNCAHQ